MKKRRFKSIEQKWLTDRQYQESQSSHAAAASGFKGEVFFLGRRRGRRGSNPLHPNYKN